MIGVALVTAAPAASAATGRPGTPDRSFAGGSVIRGFGTVPGEGGAIETAPMPDGGFLVRTSGGSVGRYLADGSRDRGFGVNGYLINIEATAIGTTADGRIYLLGLGRGESLRLSRLLPDGSPDPSFGRRGSVDLGTRTPPIEAMLIAPGGAVFLAGTNFDGGGGAAVDALRVRADGRVDSTYGLHGVARTPFWPNRTGAHFLFALDGERLAFVAEAGRFSKGSASWQNLLLGRFDPRGVLESSSPGLVRLPGGALGGLIGIADGPGDGFTLVANGSLVHLTADGALEPGASSEDAEVAEPVRERTFTAFAVQPDGKIVIGGRTLGEGPSRFVLARLDPDGSRDPTFGGESGVVEAGVEVGEGVPALSVLADGGFLLSGKTGGDPPQLAAARFTAGGTPDPTFAGGGVLVVPPVAYSDDKVNAIAAGPRGGVLATGTAGGHVLVAAYLANGRLDPGFADRGVFLAAGGTVDEQGNALARLPGGRILVGTRSRAGASLIMLGAHGRPIRSFGQGGTVPLGDFDNVSALAVSGSGAILVAGSSRKPCRFLVERLGPGGGVDRSFGTADGAARIGRFCRAAGNVDMVRRPDGNLVVAVAGTRTIKELTASGRPDPHFSVHETNWRLPKHLGAIALDTQGRLLVGGTLHHRLGLVRLSRGGELDRTFGRRGFAIREVGREAEVTGLAIEPDGKILVSGIANACPPFSCHGPTALIARFDSDGAGDPEFGRAGVWTGRREASALDSLVLAGEGTFFAGGWSTLRGDRNLLLVKVHR